MLCQAFTVLYYTAFCCYYEETFMRVRLPWYIFYALPHSSVLPYASPCFLWAVFLFAVGSLSKGAPPSSLSPCTHIHVEPQLVLFTHIGDLVQRVKGPQDRGTGRGADQKRNRTLRGEIQTQQHQDARSLSRQQHPGLQRMKGSTQTLHAVHINEHTLYPDTGLSCKFAQN